MLTLKTVSTTLRFMVSSPTLFTGALPLKSLNQRCPDRESFCAVSSAFARKLFSVRSVLPKASLNDAFSPLQSTTSTETNNNPAPAVGSLLEFPTQKATQAGGASL